MTGAEVGWLGGLIGETGTWILAGTAIVLFLLLGTAMLALVTFATRGTPLRRIRAMVTGAGGTGSLNERVDGKSPIAAADPEFPQVARVLCNTDLADGHCVECFVTGDALFDALLADVAAARGLITWHVYWFKPGRLAERVAEVLCERARAGVRVLMLFDHFGSKGVPEPYMRRLRAGGVEVADFRPPRWNTLYKLQNRMHIRAVVIDATVGYTGGFGIDDRWLGDGRHAGGWRDTSVRITGASVDQLQGAFASNWGEATGDLVLGNAVFSHRASTAATAGQRESDTLIAGLMYSSPSLGSTSAERYFFTSLASARERWYLATAYFVPDRHLRRMLCDAAQRGVDVRVLTPGEHTDRPSTWYAARAHYAELLDGGVRLYEYCPTMMHAKTLVVDDVWSMVGTLNFDNRSMVLNDEVALLMWDRAMGARLTAAFHDDLRFAQELDIATVRGRPWWPDRLLEWGAGRIDRLL
ncbi:MAG: hypothetical protein H0X64_00520 [Gemmatimonadaceae bacterium]|nr:hypothetical protein [Gemmatimonadaceae bacterium]